MKRGEIYYANLDPTIGAEIQKKRPVLIISNNASNKVSALVTVLPLTSNTTKIYPFEVGLSISASSLKKNSKIQCQQIRTISKDRISTAKLGQVDRSILLQVQRALELHLDFSS